MGTIRWEFAAGFSVQLYNADWYTRICEHLDKKNISSYIFTMRRKKGALIPLELSIIAACLDLIAGGTEEAHGFLIAKQIGDQSSARMLTSHGTLYKALDRMEKTGLLKSHWEDPILAASESRPRRRLYRVTAQGETAFEVAPTTLAQSNPRSRRVTT